VQGLTALALLLLWSGRVEAQTEPDTAAELAAEAVGEAEPVTETVRVHVLPARPGVEAHVRLGSLPGLTLACVRFTKSTLLLMLAAVAGCVSVCTSSNVTIFMMQ
jgi:hypothetical protein